MRAHRHRLLFAASGIVMVASGLAQVARHRVDEPFALTPQLFGAVIASYAFVTGPRSLAFAIAATRTVLGVVVAGVVMSGVYIVATPMWGFPIGPVFQLVIGCGLLMIIGVVGPIEDAGRTLAGVAIAVGAMETVWYLFVEPPLTSDGQFVLAAAVGTLLGGTMWRRSAAVSAALHGGSELPHAQVRRS
jgi:hypothetical protein